MIERRENTLIERRGNMMAEGRQISRKNIGGNMMTDEVGGNMLMMMMKRQWDNEMTE